MKESSSLRWIAFVRPAVGLLLFYKEKSEENENMKNYKIAVAGTGYVGLWAEDYCVEYQLPAGNI